MFPGSSSETGAVLTWGGVVWGRGRAGNAAERGLLRVVAAAAHQLLAGQVGRCGTVAGSPAHLWVAADAHCTIRTNTPLLSLDLLLLYTYRVCEAFQSSKTVVNWAQWTLPVKLPLAYLQHTTPKMAQRMMILRALPRCNAAANQRRTVFGL